MEKSGVISSNAHMAGMSAAKPGRFEYEVEAAIEQVYMQNGAMTLGLSRRSSAAAPTPPSSTTTPRAGRCRPATCCSSTPPATTRATPSTSPAPIRSAARSPRRRRRSTGWCWRRRKPGMAAAKVGNKTADVEKAAEEVVKAGLLKLGPHHRRQRRAVPHLVHARHLPLDRHGRARRRRLPEAARRRHDLRGRAGHLRPAAGARRPGRHAGEPRSSRTAVRAAVEKYKFIGVRDRGLVPADRPPA